MPVASTKYKKGSNVYLTNVSDEAYRRGFRTIDQGGEESYYSVFSNGIVYDGHRQTALDLVNVKDIEVTEHDSAFIRAAIRDVLLVSEFEELKKNNFKDDLEPIGEGVIITINALSAKDRIVYAKIMNVKKSPFGDQYEVVTTGSNTCHTLRRSDIDMPTKVFNTRRVIIQQEIAEYKKGDEAQIIDDFLYIGGDDILIHEKFAKNKKII